MEMLSLVQRWLAATAEEAEALLPDMLDLSPLELRRRLDTQPAIVTVGLMEKLLGVAHYCLDRHPKFALELTEIAVEFIDRVRAPVERESVLLRARALTWKEHANALSGRGRLDEALAFVDRAREALLRTPEAGVLSARVDLAEAQIRIKRLEFERALKLAIGAAAALLPFEDLDGYVTARMTEAYIYFEQGHRDRAFDVWTDADRIARKLNNNELRARIFANMGRFEVFHERYSDAIPYFRRALDFFKPAKLTREVVRVRWNLAEAMAYSGRLRHAISELYFVRTEFLRIGAVLDAANASVMIIDYLLIAGRKHEIPHVAQDIVITFRDGGLMQNAMDALTYLRSRSEEGEISRDDTSSVRRFFEDLPHAPKAPFIPTT
jgi:tetratricopeptide (TPR) repeat protein